MLALYPFLVLLQNGKSGLAVVHIIGQTEVLVFFVLQVVEFLLEGGDECVSVHGLGCFCVGAGSVHRVVIIML